MSGPYEPPYDPQYPQDPGPYPYQQYPGQQYPGQQYPGQQYPGQPSGPGRPGHPGTWSARRAVRPTGLQPDRSPRFGIALAGAGVALAILGVLIWGFTYIFEAPGSVFNRNRRVNGVARGTTSAA